ncbi:MAG: hypothetical protein P1P87_01250 [Trueperaceae bacterium]|nr:hypothetical protein [Trueperaceae bacterium]
MSTKNGTIRRATWTALPLGLVLVGALALSPALAQDAAGGAPDATADTATTEPSRRAGAFFARRAPDGAVAMHGWRVDSRGGPLGAPIGRRDDVWARLGADGEALRGEAFARWLEADADVGPIVPGLVGRLTDGTSVRLVFYAGAPEDGGAVVADLTFVAGEGDAAAFRDEVRAAAADATHVVVDVLGRVVALPDATPVDAAE